MSEQGKTNTDEVTAVKPSNYHLEFNRITNILSQFDLFNDKYNITGKYTLSQTSTNLLANKVLLENRYIGT